MKKRSLIIVGAILLLIVILQLIWSNKQDGNLILLVANNTQTIDTINLEVYVDDKEIGEYSLLDTAFLNYQFIPLYKSLGKHKVTFKIDGKDLFEKELFLLSVRWLIVDIVVDGERATNEKYEELEFVVSNQFKPPMLY